MDTLTFRFEPAAFPTGPTHQLVPVVNGERLLDLPVPVRRTKAGPNRRATGTVRLGGGHAGLALHADRPPDLTHLRPSDRPHRAAVLGCECGVTGCAPVLATVAADGDVVTWAVAGREFRFDRPQYEAALRAAEAGTP